MNNDPEQIEKMKQISELLTAAGYLRARIPNLSDLDKILGGITWALTSCFHEIEFEFKDEMSLGEKVRVAEKIAKGLKNAGCPISINAIQIQGLDVKVIFNVIQWLVKFLHETRDERNLHTKKNALSFFNINNSTQHIIQEKKVNDQKKEFINKTKYNLLSSGRQLRAISTKNSLMYNEELRIYFTLIEYGLKKDLKFQKDLIDLLKKKNLIQSKANKGIENTTTNAKKDLRQSLNDPLTGQQLKEDVQRKDDKTKQISDTPDEKELDALITTSTVGDLEIITNPSSFKIETSILEEIFNSNFDKVSLEIQKFEELEKNVGFDKYKFMIKEKERIKSAQENTLSQIKEYELEKANLQDKAKALDEVNNDIEKQVKQIEIEISNNTNQLQKLLNKIEEKNYPSEKLNQISDKVVQRENIKEEISKFKNFCKEEKIKLEEKLENTEKKKQKMNSEENVQAFDEIDTNYSIEVQNLIAKKQSLFEENKIINLLTRKIQVYPSKLELIQYQKRFQELYDQINLINEKNRELINEINSKEEVKRLLQQKQDTFLNLKNVYKELKTKKDKENFKVSLEGILTSVTESALRSGNRLLELNKNLETAKVEVIQKQEYEQKYMKLVKEYNREYNKLYSNK
jgi:hypothetical protein